MLFVWNTSLDENDARVAIFGRTSDKIESQNL